MRFMPPKERRIIIPIGGWIDRAFYVVEVAFSETNPVHRQIFYTGIVDQENEYKPGKYNEIWCATCEDPVTYDDVFYMRPVHFIGKMSRDYVGLDLEGEYNLAGEGYVAKHERIREDEV